MTMRYRPLFIVGCPRSGTTWVQFLLHHSAHIATAPETHIVSLYLSHFRRQWDREHHGPAAKQGGAGLSRLLSDDGFRSLCRHTVIQVLDSIAATKPGATIVADKSPTHAVFAAWIRELLPEAQFLHVVRDPRDAVVSITRAARTWGSGWAPSNVIDAARMWVHNVRGARAVAGDTAVWHEVRYEDLRADPLAVLRQILAWLGVPENDAFLQEAVAANDLARLGGEGDLSRLPTPATRSPKGFFGEGAVGGWKNSLSPGAQRRVEIVCGPLMDEFGYARSTGASWSARVRVHDAIQRLRESVDWQLQRLLSRI